MCIFFIDFYLVCLGLILFMVLEVLFVIFLKNFVGLYLLIFDELSKGGRICCLYGWY